MFLPLGERQGGRDGEAHEDRGRSARRKDAREDGGPHVAREGKRGDCAAFAAEQGGGGPPNPPLIPQHRAYI